MTSVDAEGPKGNVKLIFTVVNRQNIHQVIPLVNKYNSQAFYSIEDIRYVSEVLPSYNGHWGRHKIKDALKTWRKGK